VQRFGARTVFARAHARERARSRVAGRESIAESASCARPPRMARVVQSSASAPTRFAARPCNARRTRRSTRTT